MGSFVMKSQQFQDILNAVPLLTNQQRNTLINALSEENPSTDIAKTIEESFVRAPKCPHCGSESLQRWGGLGIIASIFGARLAEEP